MTHKDRFGLVVWLIVSGLFVTFVHEFTYRRTGGDDFELGGYVSHAGTDMLIVMFASTITALLWSSQRGPR